MIPIVKPLIGEEEKQAVLKVLSSGMLAQGKVVEEFEERFAAYIGTKFAIACGNGTEALHVALMAAGIGQGDEVITTPFTFIASANSVLFTGAKLGFVDINERTFNIDPDLIEAKITPKTRAIMPVHLFGLPADLSEILKIANKHNLLVIEDAAQAHGASINGKKVGSFGLAGCFSFYPTKNMTTGEGGMITTNNAEFAEKCRLLRNHGARLRYYHESLGYNFRMTNISAAIGIEQLKKLNEFNDKRRENAQFLNQQLSNIKGIATSIEPSSFKHVYHQYTIKVEEDYGKNRDELATLLNKHEVETAVFYPLPVHKQKVYIDLGYKAKLPVAEKVSKQVLSLPIHPSLTKKDLLYVSKVIAMN